MHVHEWHQAACNKESDNKSNAVSAAGKRQLSTLHISDRCEDNIPFDQL